MEKKRLEYYKKKLEAKFSELTQTVSKVEHYGREVDEEPSQDIADKASNSYEKEFLFSLTNNDRFVLQLVQDALERIKNGSFGHCIVCEEEVQVKRLEAVPWARHCIDCQEKQEQGLLN